MLQMVNEVAFCWLGGIQNSIPLRVVNVSFLTQLSHQAKETMQVFGQSADRQKTQKAVYCLCFRKAKGRKASDSLQVFLFKEGAYRIPFKVFILYQMIDKRGGQARPSVFSTSSLLLWDSM